MSKLFNTVKGRKVKKSNFNLSHEHRLSADFGKLYPVMVKEVIPGDTWSMKTEAMTRVAPMISPIYHKVKQYVHSFYVPMRLIWNDYEEFFSGSSHAKAPPQFVSGSPSPGGLADHLGIPPGTDFGQAPVSALPFRVYNKIWNDYYRDQNFQIEREVTNLNGVSASQTGLANRAWEKDYFTSALPFAQKFADVKIPVQNTVFYSDPARADDNTGQPLSGDMQVEPGTGAVKTGGADTILKNIDDIDTLININDFRIAHRLQRWFETQARAGSRYFETLLGQFGVKTDDLRLSRPEYLGGSMSTINVSEVLQTSKTDTSPQGNMSGHGITVGNDGGFKKHFKEHGFIMSIMSYRPTTAYHQGIDKMWTRQDVFDYAWPELANLGEQEILKQEIFNSNNEAINNTVWGYQSRYAEYKYAQSRCAGDLRPTVDTGGTAGNRAEYTLTRDFRDVPLLDTPFIECSPDYLNDRIFTAGSAGGDPFWVYLYFSIIARRPLPYYGTPTL